MLNAGFIWLYFLSTEESLPGYVGLYRAASWESLATDILVLLGSLLIISQTADSIFSISESLDLKECCVMKFQHFVSRISQRLRTYTGVHVCKQSICYATLDCLCSA